MKHFTCGSAVPGCTATFSAETTDEILDQVAGHAVTDHGLREIPQDIATRVIRGITE
jgi:predicted small metal-binding protein